MQINENLTAKGYTRAADVPAVFGLARSIDEIVIHHWGALGQTHDGVVNFFVNGPGETSAHFVVSAGRVNCLVSPADAAWHSGSAVGNATSIGIECRPEASDGDYATVAELVAWLRSTYGKDLPLFPHRYYQSTACPGVWDLTRLDKLARKTVVETNPLEEIMAWYRDKTEFEKAITKIVDDRMETVGDRVWKYPAMDPTTKTAKPIENFLRYGLANLLNRK